jgi:hypothetical protein
LRDADESYAQQRPLLAKLRAPEVTLNRRSRKCRLLWRWRWIAALVLPLMEFGRVRPSFVVALAAQQRGEGGATASGRQLNPADVEIHDYLNSMHKCSVKVVVRQPRYPESQLPATRTPRHGNLRLSKERDPFGVLLVIR